MLHAPGIPLIRMSSIINLASDRPVLPEFPHSGICILESRHKHGFVMEPSSYDFFEVMLILEGKGFVTGGKVRHPIRRHDIITVAEKVPYFYEDDPHSPLAMLCLCLRPNKENREILAPVLPVKFHVLRNANLAREISSHLRAIFFEQSQSRKWSSAVIMGQVLLMLSKIARRHDTRTNKELPPSSSEIEAVVRVRDYISKLDSNFHESETIESAASRLKMSPRSLTHHFRRITGVSRLQYIQQLRLQHARYLLRDSSDSITSIAFACGFDDLSNFFRIFRAHEKISPSQWRDKNRLRPRS